MSEITKELNDITKSLNLDDKDELMVTQNTPSLMTHFSLTASLTALISEPYVTHVE